MARTTTAFVHNADTGEVYHRTPDKGWRAAFDAWRTCYGTRRCSYHVAAVPSPMPWGHVMFEGQYGETYVRMDTAPVPVWTDGVGALFVGQRVGWEEGRDHTGYRLYRHGRVAGYDAQLDRVAVTLDDGGVEHLEPYAFA